MKSILLLHGANLNRLGNRDVKHYGRLTLHDIEEITRTEAKQFGFEIIAYQSNHEGDLIDTLQQYSDKCQGIIINAGAFAHYSYALHDALLDTQLFVVEVHLSNIFERELWRRQSVLAPACISVITGQKQQGYQEAIRVLAERINSVNHA